jgi:hypothetical protein
MDNPYSDQELTNTECRVGYEKFSNENSAWAISLVLMSWALKDFQTKMEVGHCHNTAHVHGPVKPREIVKKARISIEICSISACARIKTPTNSSTNGLIHILIS